MDVITKPYEGRVLALNPEKARRFQCGGFWLGPKQPYARVPQGAETLQLRNAVADGRLIDITDELDKYTKGGSLLVAGSEIGQAAEIADTGKKVYFLKDAFGATCALIPETSEQAADLERQVASSGKLVLPPGFDNPEKYLFTVERYEAPMPSAETPA